MTYYKERKYKTAKDLETKLEEFTKIYDSSEPNLIPTKGKLDLFLGIVRNTRMSWKETRPDLASMVELTELWIKEQTITQGYAGNRHAEFQLARAFKMTEKQVIEQTNLNMEMSEDEKKERLKRLKGKK